MKTIKELRQAIEREPERSAWARGVKNYAYDLFEEWDEKREYHGSLADHEELLNGAKDWKQYSWGGCALCYNADIAKHLCTPSLLKRKRNGNLPPSRQEEWLDVQTRALFQAEHLINRLAKD